MEFDNISISDLTWELVPYYGKKAERKTVSDIKRPDRFVASSTVSQRDFMRVEKFFCDVLKDIEFVELSPLQPLGLNSVLAGTNGKKLIPTIRGQEVNSDATTALFLEASWRFGISIESLRLATNVRTVRPKVFDEESKFLPHFKVFAEVTVGRQSSPYGRREVEGIARHLRDELKVLGTIRKNVPNNISSLNVYVSNLVFLREMLRDHKNTNSVLEAQKAWEESKWPRYLPLDDDLVMRLAKLGITKGLRILEMFLWACYSIDFPTDGVNFFFDLSRSAGMDYYKHIAYKITAVSPDGLELPLADGGSNDWGVKMFNDKQIYTVSSGVGTELLIQHYLRLA